MPSFDPTTIDVPDFLDCLEIRNATMATVDEMRFSCPFPNHAGGDESPSCYMNVHTTAFFCHGCKERGNAIAFTVQVLGISPLEAIRMLRQRYSPGSINPDARDVVAEVKKIIDAKPEKVAQPIIDESEAEARAVMWDEAYYHWQEGNGHPACNYMFERDYDPVTLTEWEFGYDAITDRVSFAVRDAKGNLIGFKARAHDGRHPKYLVLGDSINKAPRFGFPRYYPSRVVFGAHRVKPDSDLVVCEGELNAVAVVSKTGLPAVAINGSNFTDDHAKIIRGIAKSVTLFLDTDAAGNDAVWGWADSKGEWHPGIIERLSQFVPVKLVQDHEGDAAEMERAEIEKHVSEAKSALRTVIGIC